MKKTTLLISAVLMMVLMQSGVNAQSITTIATSATTTPTPTNKVLQQVQNQTTRMQNIKTKADGYITERISAITNFIAFINASKVASSTQAKQAITALNTDISGLTSLKTQIDAFNDPSNIKSGLMPLVQQIFTTYRIYAIELPKYHLLLHIAYFNVLNTNFTAAEQNLTQDITFAQGQSKNVTTIQADNTKYSNDVAKFNSDVQTAEAALNAITPADYQKGASAFTTVKADYAIVHTDIQAVHSDFTQFIKDFKALFNL